MSAGQSHSISRFRRLVIDLMHFSARVPSITIERRMELASLVAARSNCLPSPTWTAIFTKAYAVVAARTPVLRCAYMDFPWPRFYENAVNIATLNIDRQLAEERIVLYAHVESPEKCSLAEIDSLISEHQERPVESIPSYRTAVRLSRVPWPFRRIAWWWGLNVSGSMRCRHFGTFGITSLGALGASVLHLVPLLTTTIHYGMLEPTGRLDVRLSFDHRVLDGAAAANALGAMESVLLGEIKDECAGLSPSADARAPTAAYSDRGASAGC